MNAVFWLNVPTIFSSLLLTLTPARTVIAAERAPERVRIAVSSKSLGFFDTRAAKERGFYRKQGLDAEIIAMRPPLTIGAIQACEIDYAFGAIYSRLVFEDGHPLPGAITTMLDQQGKPELQLHCVVDATVVDEVLRERR